MIFKYFIYLMFIFGWITLGILTRSLFISDMIKSIDYSYDKFSSERKISWLLLFGGPITFLVAFFFVPNPQKFYLLWPKK